MDTTFPQFPFYTAGEQIVSFCGVYIELVLSLDDREPHSQECSNDKAKSYLQTLPLIQ